MPEGVFDFPSLHLYSDYDPFAVRRDFWHDGRLRITGTSGPFLLEETDIRIRGRGSSTWAAGPEKRPLRLRFGEPRTLLDSPHAANDWVLIANLFDLSLVRTHMAFYFAGMLEGMYWTPFSRLVHLYINGEYQGVYQLADERDTAEGRARLTFDPDPAKSGFLFEIDGCQVIRDTRIARGDTLGVDFLFVNDWAIDVRFPHRRDRDNHMAYLNDYLHRVDGAIKARDFEAVATLVDVASLIDFYLTQELFKNIDVGIRSIFMQIRGTGDERRLYFGPVWDFDRSAGSMIAWHSPSYIYAGHYNPWFNDLLNTPELFALMAERWQVVSREFIPYLLHYIQYLTDNYEAAFDRNFERHDHIFGGNPEWFDMVPQHIQDIHTAKGQLEYLKNWLDLRAVWLDGYFGG
jgi:hypothetical protein